MREPASDPVLELTGVTFSASPDRSPLDLSLRPGGFVFLREFSVSLQLLGIAPVIRGSIRFKGRTWQERSVAESERDLRRVGTVVNPRSHPARVWVGNLDVDENVVLASQFDPSRRSCRVEERAAVLARNFGLPEGLPAGRPAEASPAELILSQWVRAFLRDPLDLLVLENPLEGAPSGSTRALAREIERVRGEGAAVLWVGETKPAFSILGLEPELVLD